MKLPGITPVDSSDEALIGRLADFGGASFLEEAWTQTLLSGITDDDARKAQISRAIIEGDVREGSKHNAAYCTVDETALAVGYLNSELGGVAWKQIEDAAGERMAAEFLTAPEAQAFEAQATRMEPISKFDWHRSWVEKNMPGSDFIHFACLAVAPEARGSGAFRRLVCPFFDYADAHGIPCFLETYTERLEQLYAHFGFQTVAVHSCDEFEAVERCMVRMPAA